MLRQQFAALVLCCILLCANFVPADSAEVVHAYRKPSEADLQWLFGDTLTHNVAVHHAVVHINESTTSSSVIQAGHAVPRSHHPCQSVQLPKVPPAPTVATNRVQTGLAEDESGVVNIASAFRKTNDCVVQMSNNRLPPPAEAPENLEVAGPTLQPPIERLPILERLPELGEWNTLNDVPATSKNVSPHKHPPHQRSANGRIAPDMLGSSVWFTGHHVGTGNTPPLPNPTTNTQFTLPTMLLSRPNVAEHFNAKVQNRIWAGYRSWNNAAAFRNPEAIERRGIEQFSFGLEKKILPFSSIELRVPMFYQFESGNLGSSGTAVELGNVSVLGKVVLLQKAHWTLTGGNAVSLPTAEDWKPLTNARLKNKAYNLVSFVGIQWHPNNHSFGHFIVQSDLPIEENELFHGGHSVKVDGEHIIRTGIQLGRWIYRSDSGGRPARLGAFAEVHYAVVTDGSAAHRLSDELSNISVSALDSRSSTLTAAIGIPMVFGNLTCTNSFILPLSGNDRPFSVGYTFSLSRLF